MRRRSGVVYAEPDYLQTVDGGTIPNDANFGNQWAAQNQGQIVNGTPGTAGADERSALAWGVTTGTSSVVVAVLDTGVQYSHPDLLTNMWVNPGGIGGCAAGTYGYNIVAANCDPMDDDTAFQGHGTHVAGIIGAVGNNAAGVAGVNWTTSIMAVKWVGSGGTGFTSDLISAMDWVVKAKQSGVNVRVVNDSQTWPGTAFSQALSDEIDLLGTNDILFVAAAGNTNQNNDTIPRYPCSYNRPTEICAAASDQNDNLWINSNFGPTTVHLAAPGSNIFSTLRQSNYAYISGGSMAAAQTSGAAALILSTGYQSVANLKSIILSNVDDLPSLTKQVATGGRLNVCKAVPGCASASPGTPVDTILPLVNGVPNFGSVLGESTGVWLGLPSVYTYQWERCDSNGANCFPIAGATSPTYSPLGSADLGVTLAVAVTASNNFGTTSAQSAASSVVAASSSPFAISSTIQDGSTINGSVQWSANPSQSVNFVQFYVDGVLTQTDSVSPYIFNQGTTGLFDTTTLWNGKHALGVRALAADNRTYGFTGATVTVQNQSGTPIGVQVSPASASIPATQTQQFSATVSGTTFTSVIWSLSPSIGTLSASGLYTPPSFVSTSQNVTITATSIADPSKSSSATLSLVGAPVGVQINPPAVSLFASQTQQFTASVSGTSNGGVTWAMTPSIGTLSPSGMYTAPAPINNLQTVNVSAQSVADPTKSSTSTVSLTPPGATVVTLVSQVSAGDTSGKSFSSFSAPAANHITGNLLVVICRNGSNFTAQNPPTDTAGDTFVGLTPVSNSSIGVLQMWYAKNIKGNASNVVTCNFPSPDAFVTISVLQYTGADPNNPLDAQATGSGTTSATSGATSALTPAKVGEIIVAGASVDSGGMTFAPGTGFTLRDAAIAATSGDEDESITTTGS
ncbi:MAG: S8 family serine peptidase, partial [Candidatus Acidiferrales bacterium]